MLASSLVNWAVLSRPPVKSCHDVGGEPGLTPGKGLGLNFIIFSHCDQRKYFAFSEVSLNFFVSKNEVHNRYVLSFSLSVFEN